MPAGLDEVIAAASDSAGVLLRGSGRYGVAASQAVLDALDQLWLEHLSFAIELREGIHLRLLAREDPLVEFNTQIGQHFRETFGEFRRRAAQHLIAQMVDPGEAAMTREFRTPSAMWAFAIADTGLGTELERLARRLMRNWAQYLFPRRGSQYDPTCVGKGL